MFDWPVVSNALAAMREQYLPFGRTEANLEAHLPTYIKYLNSQRTRCLIVSSSV